MIVEGVITTKCPDGQVNISPMGPEVGTDMAQMVLKPFQSSTTYQNLKRSGEAVFHITDDVLLLAASAIHRFAELPSLRPAAAVDGFVLADACRWYELRVIELDDRQARTRITCDVVHRGRIRDFLGFNRAKHAVVEAAILATRIDLLPAEQICAELERLAVPVDKTAGSQEREAFGLVARYVAESLSSKTPEHDSG